jgi:hypothetical protein
MINIRPFYKGMMHKLAIWKTLGLHFRFFLEGIPFWSNKEILQTLIHSYTYGPPGFNQKVLDVKNLTNIMPNNLKKFIQDFKENTRIIIKEHKTTKIWF